MAGDGYIVNISTRSPIEVSAENFMYAGFIISGTGNKQVYIRAIGQGLRPVGVNTSLDPKIEVINATTNALVASNDNWNAGVWASQINNLPAGTYAYAPPPDPSDAAMILDLPAGAYIVKVMPTLSSGVGIVGIDDIGGATTARLTNVSTRSPVRQGAENYMYGGFIVVDAPKKFFIRAIGRGLQTLGVNTTLDPLMEIFDQKAQRTIASNDSWSYDASASELVALFKQKNGITPDDSDAGMVVCLEAGVYSPVIKPMGGSSGVGIVAVDDLGKCISDEPVYYSLSHTIGSVVECPQTSINVGVTQNITILNGGNATLTINSVTFGGINKNDFTLQTPLPLKIEVGMESKLVLSCNPTAVGTRTGTIQITTNDPKQPTVSYNLECPVVANSPKVEITPILGTTINYNQVIVNTTVTQNIIVVNRGGSDLIIGGSVSNNVFNISPSNVSIAPGATQTLTLACTPTIEGTHTGTVLISSNDPNQPNVSYSTQCSAVACTGICIKSIPEPGTSIDFGKVIVQSSNVQNVVVNNFNNTYLNINSINIIGMNSSDFIVVNPLSSLVDPNSSRSIEVRCTPSATGLRSGTLQITVADATGSKVISYPLQCVGMDSCNPNLQSRPDQSKYIAIPGDGYDGDRDIFKPTACAAGTMGEVGSWKADLQLTTYKNFEEVVKSLNVKVKGGFFVGFFGGGGKMKFSQYSKETSYAQSATLSYSLEGPNKKFNILGLSEFGKQFKDNPACFKQACGNQFVCQQTQVGELYVNMQFQFRTEAQKKEFSGKAFAGGIGFFGCGCLPIGGFLSTKISGFSASLKKEGSVKISLYQNGGDATAVTKILGSGDDIPSLSCSLDNLGACEQALEKIVQYVQNPSFINSMKTNPAVGENVFCGYDSVGVFNIPTEVTAEIETARVRLSSEAEYRSSVLERIKFLLGLTTLTADQRKALEALKPKIEMDMSRLEIAEGVCYSNLANCVAQTDSTLSNMTQFDTAVLSPSSPPPKVCKKIIGVVRCF